MTSATNTPSEAAALRGAAVYFDGTSSARNDVVVEAGAAGLRILTRAIEHLLDEWTYANLRRMSAPEGVLRLGRRGETLLARLEIRDAGLAAAIEDRAETLDRGGAAERRLRRKVVGIEFRGRGVAHRHGGFRPAGAWRAGSFRSSRSRSSTSSATRSTSKFASALDTQHLGPAFACGAGPGETAGRAALDKLVGKLEAAAALPFPLHVEVVRRAEPNAMALPGGHIYVDDGLIAKAQTPDELAGVLAHEIGHVAHRDGTRTVLQTAGLSFLFGMMLGDFVGGGAVVIAAQDRPEIVLFAPRGVRGRRL